MTKLFERLIRKRNFSERFLRPKYEECVDPFLLKDMDKAAERLKKALKKKEKVLIYGDYDADGVTASVLMSEALKLMGFSDIDIMLPNRFSDGYGMSKKVVKKAKEEGFSLVVTVDCGSRNDEIIEELGKKGVDVIVTDHHECEEELPKAVAVINPKRKDMNDELLRDLAGVGVAFKVAQALVQKGLIKEGQEKWFLDLVLIGTICDSMVLSEENRRLCYYGLKVLKKTRRVGLLELIKTCNIKKIDSEAIGFRIGPRLNASGRMAMAEKSLQLLTEKNTANAAKIALELNDLNEERRVQQNNAVKEIIDDGEKEENVIIVTGEWHEGVLGIVAGKLVEKFKKPTIVLTKKNGDLKGSGRSFGDFNLAEALEYCKDEIISGGGHAGACGVKVKTEKLEDFRKKMNEYYESLNLKNQEVFLEEKEDLVVNDFKEFSLDFIDELEELEPFGDGNREPVFLLEGAFVMSKKKMGKNEEHLGLYVRDKDGDSLKLVAFFAPEEWMNCQEGQRADIWIKVSGNEWNGQKNVEGRILKMRLVEEEIF